MVNQLETNMLNRLFQFFILSLLVLPFFGVAQGYSLQEGQKFEKIRFELINNLMVIPIEVNGTELSFVMDSGVSTPILFNLANQDSIELKNVSEITINGLGEGEPISALSSQGNFFKLGNIQNFSQKLYVVMDAGINFSPSLGVPIHGIIGYDLFRDFIVDINYSSKTIKFYNPQSIGPKIGKKYETFDMEIINRKAYLDASISLKGEEDIDVKMLLDTGSSDAVWLFEDERIKLPEKNYDDYLGKGLAGDIYGKRTKIESIKIGDYDFSDAKAAFPDMLTFNTIKDLGNRNGSLGGEILKRFNIVFDYPNGKISLRKNSNFKRPFHYNVSGIDLQHAGVRYVSERIASFNGVVQKSDRSYGNVQILLEGATRLSLVPEIIVSGIRAGSPAHSAGLKEGDVILAVNGKRIHRYKIQEIMEMLNEKEGKRVKVLVERSNSNLLFSFILKDLFK
ncbi:aspartyl protease family protein [Maribacter sp. PR1]|uniref:Aspartyl protease family protein n=1 Tax=Maribacter cobaltidurans TaxID=1178778 RepID=A0ABU7IX28_9FLAO|nr:MULTISPECIES: aspartyl protease family protein [Maribacter]MDC6390152.1 aspartyl protease family protein [Maribacter sp. PR1]MEE1977542.1 aspartyl protease family protein [Maribacter cobaltidurans]